MIIAVYADRIYIHIFGLITADRVSMYRISSIVIMRGDSICLQSLLALMMKGLPC